LEAVLNTFTEHDFPDIFRNWQKRWERCIRTKGTTSRVMVASRPKPTIWPDDSISPGNYPWLCVNISCCSHVTSHFRSTIFPSCREQLPLLLTSMKLLFFHFSLPVAVGELEMLKIYKK
jgi:hypothetical protein